MKIRFTLHALERMKQRNIKKEEVLDAVFKPDIVITDGEERRIKLQEDKALIVIGRRDGEYFVVITVFRTSKMEKYAK